MQPSATDYRWHPIGSAADLRFTPGARVACGPHAIAVFRTAEGFRAIDDSCPHQGASLAEGDQFPDGIRCPWHGWKFDLDTGRGPGGGAVCTSVYPVRERGDGGLEIGLPRAMTSDG